MKNIRLITIIYFLAGGLILSAVFNFSPSFNNSFFAAFFFRQPLFINTDNFVLFADQEIELAQFVQVSSGDLGSNGKLDIQKDNIINGNLFAKEIAIDKDTQINGNASYNKLKLHKDSRILGVTTSPVSLPIVNLPDIPPFSVGTQDFSFRGENNVLNPGSYRNITLEKDSRLTLPGGTYNLNKLELKENSTLIYNSSTILNIQFKLKGQQKALILPGNNNLSATDFSVNYLGGKDEEDEEDKNNDEEDENGENGNEDNNDKDKKPNSRPQNFRERFSSFFKNLFGFLKKIDDRKNGGVKPVQFGNDSFLNFKLLAPKASVKLGERTTLRGQVLAKEINVGEGGMLSRDVAFFLQSRPEDIITTDEGDSFIINQIIVQLTTDTTFIDGFNIAQSVNGLIVGTIPSINLYQIAVSTRSISELENSVNFIRSNPLVEIVAKNSMISIIE